MESFVLGLVLGLAAGVSPGPLLTLVFTSTLERGFGAGLRVALGPRLSDAPIVLLAVVVLKELPTVWLALLGTVGGCVVIGLGVLTLGRTRALEVPDVPSAGTHLDLAKGAVINFLNPHPWIFWITVQGPIVIQSWRREPIAAVAFVFSFYLAIVGSKIAIAWFVARGRRAIDSRWYRRLLFVCGLALISMGGWLVAQGFIRATMG